MNDAILDPNTNSGRLRSIGLNLTQPNYSAQGNIEQAKLISSQGAALETGIARDVFDRDMERHGSRERLKKYRAKKQINNVAYIAIGGFVFVTIIAWFELLRTFYDNIFEVSEFDDRFGPTFRRLGFAILVTGVAGILIILLYRNIIKHDD